MFCNNCGKQARPDAVYCNHCGSPLRPLAEGTTPEPQAALPGREDWPDLPRLGTGQGLDLKSIRDSLERFYLFFVALPAVGLVAVLFVMVFVDWRICAGIIAFLLALLLLDWIGWKLLFASLLGNAIKIGPSQYPQIHRLVDESCRILGLEPPTVFILQGHGLFEVLVAKYFSRRGFLILTSNLVDDLTERSSSRELMFFVGRQLGLLASGYFRFWYIKHVLGSLAGLFYLAWQRRCHFTADRVGLLVAGDLYAAEQALIIITAGSHVAPSTNMDALKEQRTELFDSFWSWIKLGLSAYPYMVDRIIQLRNFAYQACARGIQANAPVSIGVLAITHRPIRSLPLMIIHGHDYNARRDLELFLLRNFPHVAPVQMIAEVDAARTLPEKFERLAGEVKGALALLTPDDAAVTLQSGSSEHRARQNVILEVGWVWAKLGRSRCLLLMRGSVTLPTDLSGVEVHSFQNSPDECSESLREFIAGIEY